MRQSLSMADNVKQSPAEEDNTTLGQTLRKKRKLLNGVNIKFTFPSGATYIGSFKDGKIEGYGVYTYADSGDKYEGEWKADLKHGHGTYFFGKGDRYSGQWYMGRKHGKGEFLFANGDEFIGSWKDNQMSGYGSFFIASNGDKYVGYWKSGLRSGLGALKYGNGDVYDGEWDEGQQQGLGVFCQSNGDLYCGEWNQGSMDGKGVVREKGIVFIVEYVGGYVISKVKASDVPEDVEGDWSAIYQHFKEWTSAEELSMNGRSAVGNSRDELRIQLEATQSENSILKTRLDNIIALLQTKTPQGGADGKGAMNGRRDSVGGSAMDFLREAMEKLQTKVKLLECTIGEKALENRKQLELLKERDALITELELQCKGQRRRIRSLKRESNAAIEQAIPAEVLHPSSDDDNDGQDDEVTILKMHQEGLTKANEELHQRVAFLSSENSKLSLKLEAAEDHYEKTVEDFARFRELKERQVAMTSPVISAEVNDRISQASEPSASPASLGCVLGESLNNVVAGKVDNFEEKLVKSNQLNIELRLKNGELQKQLESLKGRGGETDNGRMITELFTENEQLQEKVKRLEEDLGRAQTTIDATEKMLFVSSNNEKDLAVEINNLITRKAGDPQLLRTLEMKSNRISELESENAELARLLEEANSTVEERDAALLKNEGNSSSQRSKTNRALEDSAAAQKELKKLQKRIKKVTAERNSVAEELYDSQVKLARLDRPLRALQGRLIVIAALAGALDGTLEGVTALSVDKADSSQLVVNDCGVDSRRKYDYCFDTGAVAEQVLSELSGVLSLVWCGFQFGLTTFGEFRSGKSTMMTQLLPLFVQYLARESGEQSASGAFQSTYRVAVVEVSARGAIDCTSGDEIHGVDYDASGYVVPKDVRFIDCTSVSIVGVIENLLAKRRQNHNGRSHTWIQLQCTRTSKVHQTQLVGRLTFYDWCGPGSMALQKADMESARFANSSNMVLYDIVAALSRSLPVVPYAKTIEAALLYDLLGGNSMTAVVGRLRSSVEHIEESLKTLSLLDALCSSRNGPVIQDYTSRDEHRWRGIVAALSSDHQAERELREVENVREY